MNGAFRARVRGRVQGVFFRASTRDTARSLGLGGWVRNLPDGDVEVFAAGDTQALGRLRRWLDQGPARARVDAVEVEDRPYVLHAEFVIR